MIHADNMDIKGGRVSWEIFGKKLNNKIIEMKDVKLGGFRDRVETRPFIKLDMVFNGTLYKNLNFTLDDRGKKTPLLINRNFMKEANLMIDPSRKFILTEKIEK